MYNVKVDSCRLSIPLQNCEILNKDLQDDFIDYRVNLDTGEQAKLKTHSGVPFIKTFDDDTYIKIWIEPQISYNAKTKQRFTENYLTLLVNSKHLQHNYFQGITKYTIKQLYDYMMSLDVFSCTYNSFINSRYADIDLAFDFKCTHDNFKILKENVINSALNPTHFHTIDKKDNSGIWTPTRRKPREQATPSRPYIKFYSKEYDFKYKSFKFAKKHFKEDDYKDIVRYECTIKNTQHKKRLSLNNYPTFISFLNSDLQSTSRLIFNEYFKKAKFVKSTNIKPMDKVVIDLINTAIELGAPKNTIHDIFNRYDVSPKARQRLLQKYNELYSSEEINIKRLEANQITKDIFSFLGVDLSQTKLDL